MQITPFETFKELAGRGTFEPAGGWGGDHHDGVPIYILSRHPAPAWAAKWPAVRYVSDLASAVRDAKQAAGDKNVLVHGAGITQRALAAGLLDEMEIHLIPVLLGEGRRLFEHLGVEQRELERIRVLEIERNLLRYLLDKQAHKPSAADQRIARPGPVAVPADTARPGIEALHEAVDRDVEFEKGKGITDGTRLRRRWAVVLLEAVNRAPQPITNDEVPDIQKRHGIEPASRTSVRSHLWACSKAVSSHPISPEP